MGSSEKPGGNAREIDASVGGLVWVRRRNGSWWPGRIVGLDEIAEGSLVSPRLGTPVKLLGREDASVDWYNLEKSKRVKAFRCGEYDDCIEKARANAANNTRKAVKYVRREDAILHALEIENDRLAKDPSNASFSNNSGAELVTSAKESPDSGKEDEESDHSDFKKASDSGVLEEGLDSRSGSDSGSAPELSQSSLSFEEPARAGASKVQCALGKRRKTPNDSEDDGTEGTKRMRGLVDLGMVVGDSNGSPSNGRKSVKRKRTQVANAHEFLKRKNRRRPLTKVLESTAVVSVPVTCDQVTNPDGSPLCGMVSNISDFKVSEMESNESRKCSSVVGNNNSGSNGVSCEDGDPSEDPIDALLTNCKVEEENFVAGVLGDAENEFSDKLFDVPFVEEGRNSAGLSPIVAEDPSLGNELHNECGSPSTASTHISNITQRTEKDASKWQSKGKRNSRQKGTNRKLDKRKHISIDNNLDPNFPETDPLDRLNWGTLPQSRFTVNSRYQTSEFPERTVPESNLYDVKLEVKSNYQPQNVPLVSLMSKLNGKAIVGHPLTVEPLAEGHGLIASNEPVQNGGVLWRPTKLTRLKRRFSKGKSRRKRSGILSKKIRKLSSLTSNKGRSKIPVVEKVKSPVVACIPLKVVFSRINEALKKDPCRGEPKSSKL